MRDFLRATATLLFLSCATGVHAQQSQPAAAVSEAAAVSKNGAGPNAGAVPNVIRFSGSFRSSNGMPAQVVESVTLSVYRDQTGGTPLWQETQNVGVDGEGKYSVLMGSTQNDGVPLDLLSAGEPRWLGVQVNRPGEPEQPRVLMASVPYALKSVDAETLGGKPASAYLLASASTNGVTASGIAASGIAATTGVTTPTTVLTNATNGVKPRATNGTAGFIGVFTDATDIGNSVMQQSNGFVGVGTVPGAGAGTTPSLDLRTTPFSQIGMAQTTDYLTFFASDVYGPAIYWDPNKDLRFGKGGTPLYNAFGFIEQMRIQSATGNVGIGTQAPVAKLEVNGPVQADGNVTITTTGNGLIFPDGSKQTTAAGGGGGGGSVTGVTAGTDLTGGGTSGIVTLNLNTALVPTLAGANTFTASNAFTGSLSAGSLTVTGTAQGNLVAAQNVNFSGSVLYQGSPVLQVPGGVGSGNIALGIGALTSNTTGSYNLATGTFALNGNVGGNYNLASGYEALFSNVSGNSNAAIGYDALMNNTGSFNTAVGINALKANGSSGNSVGIGYNALIVNTGGNNTAVGTNALSAGVSNTGDVAIGYNALLNSTATGTSGNTAVGYEALQGGTPGSAAPGVNNTALGFAALQSNTTGSENTALGYQALQNNIGGMEGAGSNNTAIGYQALQNNTGGLSNTAIGYRALSNNTTGSENIAIGFQAGNNITSGAGNIYIGNLVSGDVGDIGTIRIGAPDFQSSFFAAGVRNVTPHNNDGVAVFVDSAGQFGTASSSRRFKEDIQDMGDASRDLMRLRPVTFRYKKPFADGSKPVQYGLIAEEVDEVYPDLVAHSADGQIETVKYQVLGSMLLNEVQRQQEEIRRLEERLAKLETALASMSAASAATSVHANVP